MSLTVVPQLGDRTGDSLVQEQMGQKRSPPQLSCTQYYSYPQRASHCKSPWASQLVISRGYAGLLQHSTHPTNSSVSSLAQQQLPF